MIKVLLVSADPKENHPLNLDREFRRIEKVHQSSKYRDEFDITHCLATTYEDLSDRLLDYKPSIVHFCGHGVGKDGIVLVDENGKKEIIKTEILANLFKIVQQENKNIFCVVFNACHAEFQAKEINKYIKYAIGMSREIKDDHSICFAREFYKAIFLKTTIETAFELGRNEIRRFVSNNSNTVKRAEYDPAPGDKIASQSILDYEIPQLIVNEDLEDIYKSDRSEFQKQRIISYQQWNEFESILSKIDFDILKSVCRDTLKKDIQDIDSKILKLENLLDLKILFLEEYPICKGNNIITILNFATHLIIEKEASNSQKLEIKNWLDKIAEEKNLDLSILLDKTKSEISSSDTILNSYLLISIIENTGIGSNFSLEAELIFNYQEGDKNYKSTTITSRQEGINEVSPEEIESYISELISIAIDKLPPNHNLTIELFAPFDYLAEIEGSCNEVQPRKICNFLYYFSVRSIRNINHNFA
jgi:hypothetical protein